MSELKYGVAYVNGLKYGFAYAYVCAVFTPSWTEALGSAQCQFSLRGIERPKQGTFLSLAGNLPASSTEKVHSMLYSSSYSMTSPFDIFE